MVNYSERRLTAAPVVGLYSGIPRPLLTSPGTDEPRGWFGGSVQAGARVLREKNQLTTSFIFQYHRDIGGGLTKDGRIKGSAITYVNFV